MTALGGRASTAPIIQMEKLKLREVPLLAVKRNPHRRHPKTPDRRLNAQCEEGSLPSERSVKE